ncbi:ABC transporter permease subunit [Kineococcus siccus]|uniref:ABC transporter permease subunit n=1 Tax=Kineococcus siccus TaxID=2696567 RepID=UPI00196B666B
MSAPAVDRPAAARPGRVLPFPVTGQEVVLIAVIAVLWVALSLATPAFATEGSVVPLLVAMTPIALIGIGMTVVIVTGGIDVSVGSTVMVCAVVIAKAMVGSGIPLVAAVALGMGVGALLGLLNGALIAFGRVQAIIITFGTLNLFRFAGLQVFGSATVEGIPPTLAPFGRGDEGRTLGVPHSFLLLLVVAAVAWYYLRHTAGGRHFFAIGGDPTAARLAGISVRTRIVLGYVLTGLLAGVAACFVIAQGTSSLAASVGSGLELSVIAAVVIGGTSITGGRGSVLGTLLGALLVQTVRTGVTQLGWPSQLSDLFVGAFIVVAVGADLLRQRRRPTPKGTT